MSNKNIKVEVTEDTITITAPIVKPLQLSESGKSFIVASSHGNIETDALFQDKNVIIGFTAYIKKDKKERRKQ